MIKNIQLSYFRNHVEFSANCDSKFVLIVGPNSSGKTSILEAISMLTPDKGGMRGAAVEDVLCSFQNIYSGWSVVVMLGDDHISTGFDLAAAKVTRSIMLNGSRLSKRGEILRYLRVIWLTPQMDNILVESSLMRRKFFDRICYNIFPEHAKNITKYEYYMRSRMKVLEQHYDDVWLSSIEREMSLLSVIIIKTRGLVLEKIKDELSKLGSEYLRPEIELLDNLSSLDEKCIEVELRKNRLLDLKSSRTSFGPHRVDINVINSKSRQNIKLCSTSERKSMLIALTMSQINAIATDGSKKILLLDELLSHFDEKTSEHIIDKLAVIDAQIWITDTRLPNTALPNSTTISLS
ncbi:DNA replication and repair protein RecF [Candidatus Cyrtobacter comes]|uniref:DNA replication and repair protein RecF n=1 Tax=Candidatus Cyrtobacter comes TaxID=675776 RepID=A0ABU5L6G2_9RICK|nr:AAA family ATPase [Candidatus Cyrtobacter comes]MDZ5761714.1 DNA replication and repair protein RecF [Candidatus Cyrtobacter comes]